MLEISFHEPEEMHLNAAQPVQVPQRRQWWRLLNDILRKKSLKIYILVSSKVASNESELNQLRAVHFVITDGRKVVRSVRHHTIACARCVLCDLSARDKCKW